MKRFFILIASIFLILTLAACGVTEQGNQIPDVFGIEYTEATGILEAEGFDVRAIEVDVESFSVKLLYPLRIVNKGTVFKIDDYIIDNNGNLNKNYDYWYEGGLVSADKSIVIYYAKDDYVLVEDDNESNDDSTQFVEESSTEVVVETEANKQTEATVQTVVPETQKNNGLRAEFKAAMDSYESYMDEYVEFMKKYKANPTDIRLIAEYAQMMTKYAKMVSDFEKWETEEMNDSEMAYYIQVQSRVTQKLLEVA